MVKKILLLALSVIILSCGRQAETKSMSGYEAEVYAETLAKVKKLEGCLSGLQTCSMEQIDSYLEEVERLRYKNDTTGMDVESKSACEKLEKRISILKRDAKAGALQRQSTMIFPVETNDDCLLEQTTVYPVYLERGDVLHYQISLKKPGTVKLYNSDAKELLKTHLQKVQVDDSLVVENKGIYLVEVNPGTTQYASIDISYKLGSRPHPFKKVKTEEIECSAKAFRAVSTPGVNMRPAFEQPRKFTLRSQLKAAFSGSSRALVPVQIPSGATDILYSLRVSTSEQDKYSDGKFPEDMNLSYNKVRFLGLPLYESQRGSGLFNTLLDDNRPLREEDAYCNMYVFRNQTMAKQFQDGTKAASTLQYDVDYSTLGTQSCNGRIPAKGSRTVYLGFENERVRFSNYIWIEVLTATPSFGRVSHHKIFC